MRGMHLPTLAPIPNSLSETISLLAERLSGPMPFPRLSFLLVGYMAWPEDNANRSAWMAGNLALLISASGAKLSADIEPQTLRAFEMFGGLGAVAELALHKLQDQLVRAQSRWLHVADIMQNIVDMDKDGRLRVAGGASISKAQDLTQRHSNTPTKTVYVTSWAEYRHVAHVLAAAAWLSREAHKQRGAQPGSIIAAALLAPEVVIRLAASYQHFGFSLLTHGLRRPVLDPDNLWRVPVPPEMLPLPARHM